MFVILYGKIGRDFVDQLTIHINQWSSDSVLKQIAPFVAAGTSGLGRNNLTLSFVLAP